MRRAACLLTTLVLASCDDPGCVNRFDTSDFCADDDEEVIAYCEGARCYAADPPPFFLWLGPTDDAPSSCHGDSPVELFQVHLDLEPGTFSCPPCACADSETTCSVPLDWTVVARTCAEPSGSSELYFGGPSGWNGACSTEPKIAADTLCPGGEPCAQSMVVDAPEATAAPCAPQPPGAPTVAEPPWSWHVLGLACTTGPDADEAFDCADDTVYLPGPPAGYRVCIERTGAACPTGFTDQFDLYKDAEDTRACSPCTCDAPDGNTCSFEVTAYGDGACGTPAGTTEVTSNERAACFDLPDGTALGSKRAELLGSAPGTCTPGGGTLTGEVRGKDLVALCCQPENG